MTGQNETPITDLPSFIEGSNAQRTRDEDGVEKLVRGDMAPMEAAKETAARLAKGDAQHGYCITRKALGAFDGDIRNVPMPECPYMLVYDPVTDNHIVVRGPDDLSELNVGKLIATTLAYFHGARPVTVYFGEGKS